VVLLGLVAQINRETTHGGGKMNQMISFCGLVCSECPAFEATRDDDDAKRKETAEAWSKSYGSDIKPEDINCFGCLTREGELFNYCTVCEIRKCAVAKDVENCAHCAEYACARLTAFFAMAPQAKATLENIHRSTAKG
jgi:hypothetical protein